MIDAVPVDPTIVARPLLPTVTGFYSNARSIHQASGDLCQQILDCDADVWGVTEAHLGGEPISALIPRGYNVVCRKDRSKHGGGLLLGAKKHLLCDPVDMTKYNVPNIAEMECFILDNVYYICCYTPNSSNTHILIDKLTQFILDHSDKGLIIMGDFNTHNKEWLYSAVPTDYAGIVTQEFSESFGLNQYVDFPTRGPNTLDLIMSRFTGTAETLPNLGTSDHVSIKFKCQIHDELESEPPPTDVLLWHSAPWHHIRGAVKRSLAIWNDCDYESPDEAEAQLVHLVQPVINTYVKKSISKPYSPAPWWNLHCKKAFKYKMKTFKTRVDHPDRYIKATYNAKTIQRKAFKAYNLKIKKQLAEMSNADRNFWSLIKDLSGLSAARSSSTPSVEALADHFAQKMSNGKDEEDDDFTPNDDAYMPLSSFKIRHKSVLKSLKKLDPNKSANGFGPRFLKECAVALAPSVTRLFKIIVKKASFVANWKIQRVTPVHKRGSKSSPSKYRPVTVVDNLSAVFEDTVKPQFVSWARHFIPDWQFGFIPDCGTTDYGVALTCTIQDCLERRKQGVLIATDIRGAFDRCWWARMKARLKKKGMRKRALRLLKSYLMKRFLKVVAQGKSSTLKELFSSVPQGGKWSDFLFDLDISELADDLCAEVIPFGYADDVALWYEVEFDHCITTAVINQDLQSLYEWGLDNKTTFEPEKMEAIVISQKRVPFDASGIMFDGEELSIVDDTTLVGLKIDKRMRWGPMVDKLAKKARQRIGALSRVRHLLDNSNLKTVYLMFIRSIMEYNSISWMGAAQSHLDKLDRVQRSAEKIGCFQVESLQSRREAAVMAMALKMLNGDTRGELKTFTPVLMEPMRLCKKRTRQSLEGIQVVSKVRTKSLDVYRRSFQGILPKIWFKIPIEIINRGENRGWLKIKSACTDFLIGKTKRENHKKQKMMEKSPEIYSTELNNELNGNVV